MRDDNEIMREPEEPMSDLELVIDKIIRALVKAIKNGIYSLINYRKQKKEKREEERDVENIDDNEMPY